MCYICHSLTYPTKLLQWFSTNCIDAAGNRIFECKFCTVDPNAGKDFLYEVFKWYCGGMWNPNHPKKKDRFLVPSGITGIPDKWEVTVVSWYLH
jgi:hypothetical protein